MLKTAFYLLKMLNIGGLSNQTDMEQDERFIISQSYDLTVENSSSHRWTGDDIRIIRPYGLSNISSVQFREFKGEMLPFTKQELPQLKCDVIMQTKTLTAANIDGESNPWTRSRFAVSNIATSNAFTFMKAWTYDKNEESQIVYNLKECVSIANDRMKAIFPKLNNAYVWVNDGEYRHLVDESIHLSRANAGSGAVGLISKNSNQVQIYNGNTTYPLDVDFLCTNNTASGSNGIMRQCFSNYNNSIVIADYCSNYYTSQATTRYQLFFNPNTTDTSEFSETQQWSYAWSDSIVYDRCIGSVFAIIHDEDDKAYNAVMNSALYGYYNDGLVLSSPCLFVADPTATGKYRKIVFEIPSWTQFMADNFSSIDNSFCHVLAFNTIYDDDETKLYLYCLCISPKTRNATQAYYILWRSEIDIANETHGSLELIASVETSTSDFKQTLAYHYQYGADVGELYMITTNDDGDYYNFGFKYVCKVDGTILDVKQLHSYILDVDKDNHRLYYLCETKDHQGQTLATIAITDPQQLYEDGGIDGEPIEPNFHAFYLLCDRDENDLEDPYACTVKGWLRNLSDDHWNFNHVLLGALDQYYLGSSNETDTARNINTVTYVDMSLSSSTPSASIWNAITRNSINYATVPADFSDYYNASLSLEDGPTITGQGTRPTLILKDSNDDYYQILFTLRIYTSPYYFEVYTDTKEFNLPEGSYSLMFGPVDMVFNQVNTHVISTLEMLITMQYEFNDLILKCTTFPNIDNVVFSINEASRVRFKTMSVDSTVNSLILSLEDNEGNKIDRDTISRLYGSLIVSIDWVQ